MGPGAPPTEVRTDEEQAVYEKRMEILRKHPYLESIRCGGMKTRLEVKGQ